MMQMTPEHALALKKMNDPNCPLVFITGRAGSGKSTLLRHFQTTHQGAAAYVAPTGVAALNIGGMTIHSFLGFPANITAEQAQKIRPRKRELFKKLETLVIDEISMVRADLLDAIDVFLKRFGPNPLMPFGGIKMIWFGDLYQLPPVVTPQDQKWMGHFYTSPYFFNSFVFRTAPECELVELQHIFRQSDPEYIEFLNKVRTNQISKSDVDWFHGAIRSNRPQKSTLYLTTTNQKADWVNQNRLQSLEGLPLELKGQISGQIEAKELPTEEKIYLKKGAQIMLLSNHPDGDWVNGSMGKVVSWTKNPYDFEVTVEVELDLGRTVQVKAHEWDYFSYEWSEEQKKVVTQKRGSFKQHPIKLAWAMTIHKSQGLTFDEVHIDFDRGTFAHGQAYVALSRCRSLAGLSLARPLRPQDVRFDPLVDEFVKSQKKDHNLSGLSEAEI